MRRQRIIIWVHHLGTLNVWITFCVNPCHISLEKGKTLLLVQLERKPVKLPSMIQSNHTIPDVPVHIRSTLYR